MPTHQSRDTESERLCKTRARPTTHDCQVRDRVRGDDPGQTGTSAGGGGSRIANRDVADGEGADGGGTLGGEADADCRQEPVRMPLPQVVATHPAPLVTRPCNQHTATAAQVDLELQGDGFVDVASPNDHQRLVRQACEFGARMHGATKRAKSTTRSGHVAHRGNGLDTPRSPPGQGICDTG